MIYRPVNKDVEGLKKKSLYSQIAELVEDSQLKFYSLGKWENLLEINPLQYPQLAKEAYNNVY